jgi:hypothetical protein
MCSTYALLAKTAQNVWQKKSKEENIHNILQLSEYLNTVLSLFSCWYDLQMQYEVITVVLYKNTVVWDVTLCHWVSISKHFEEL